MDTAIAPWQAQDDPDAEPLPVRLLRAVVDIPSPSGREELVSREFVRWMTRLGYRAGLDGAGNAVGEIGDPAGPTVVLLGHLDTAPGTVPVRREGPLLYGRGTVDAKGPLAAMVCAAARVAARPSGAAGLAGDDRGAAARLIVIGAVDEERDSTGAHYVADKYRPDAVVIGEPSGARSVVIGYKGVLRFAVDVTRPSTHSSSPEPKATEVAAGVWQQIRERLAPRPGMPLFEQAIPALVRMDGDLTQARIVVSCRTPVGFDADGFGAWVRGQVPGDEYTVLEWTPAVRRPRTDPVARALCAAIRRQGGEPETKVKLGTSDMNVVAPHWPVPTATYGPGDSRLDHTPVEHIDINEYLGAIDVLADALADIVADAVERRKEATR